MSYKAIVAKLRLVQKHSNADRLQIAQILGNQVVIGLEAKSEDIGIYFPTDGKLSEEYCKANDLISYKDPVTGERKGGFFDNKRKVRCQKFRGEKSDGLFMPLKSLEFTGFDINNLKEGDHFDELNGIKLCEKYITEFTRTGGKTGKIKKENKKKFVTFHEHVDTEQLMYHVDDIKKDSIIIITEKIHGCVDKDTIINTLEKGDVTIKELVNKKEKLHIKTYNTINNLIEFEEVGEFYFKENTDNWYEITLENNIKIIITGDNPVWLPKEKNYKKISLLKNNDIVLIG